jgi:hypothetical protein
MRLHFLKRLRLVSPPQRDYAGYGWLPQSPQPLLYKRFLATANAIDVFHRHSHDESIAIASRVFLALPRQLLQSTYAICCDEEARWRNWHPQDTFGRNKTVRTRVWPI